MRLRFHVEHADGTTETTLWQDEASRDVAVMAVKELRRIHGPEARIMPERLDVEVAEGAQLVRFKINAERNQTFYTALFPISEKDERLAGFQEKFPNAKIEAQEIR